MSSKLSYLSKYRQGPDDDYDKQQKKKSKKHKKHSKSSDRNQSDSIRDFFDDDAALLPPPPTDDYEEDDDEENRPIVVDMEGQVSTLQQVKQQRWEEEEVNECERTRTSRPVRKGRYDSDDDQPRHKRHDSDSDEPPTKRCYDSEDDDQLPTRRKKRDSDDDVAPRAKRCDSSDNDSDKPRRSKKRHGYDSNKDSRKRNTSHDSADDSSQRPKIKKRYDSDDEPPTKRKQRYDSDDEQQPTKVKKRHDSDDEEEPAKVKKRYDSDDDHSPKIIKRYDSDDDEENSRARMASGHVAGLQKAGDFRDAETKIQEKKRGMAQDMVDRHGVGETVYRDELGRKVDEIKNKKMPKMDEREQALLNKGRAQKEEEARLLQQYSALKEGSFARHADDNEVNSMFKDELRDGDPMAAYATKKYAKARAASGKAQRPVYKGPPPKPNRYGIRPGYRWDGVDRGNGFEDKVLAQKFSSQRKKEDAYRWSSADM
jgi:pre-mRNA-splicing factor CWC26